MAIMLAYGGLSVGSRWVIGEICATKQSSTSDYYNGQRLKPPAASGLNRINRIGL
jgi:hypothetical protein